MTSTRLTPASPHRVMSTRQAHRASLLNERKEKIHFRSKAVNPGLSGEATFQNNTLHVLPASLPAMPALCSTPSPFQGGWAFGGQLWSILTSLTPSWWDTLFVNTKPPASKRTLGARCLCVKGSLTTALRSHAGGSSREARPGDSGPASLPPVRCDPEPARAPL